MTLWRGLYVPAHRAREPHSQLVELAPVEHITAHAHHPRRQGERFGIEGKAIL